MALASSGQLSFTDIVGEFGGSGSHSLSEYYPLLGQGVTGLPSSGQFSFSQFHGKDKDVSVTNWVTSGYNQNYTQNLGSLHSSSYYSIAYQGNNNYQYYIVVGGTAYFTGSVTLGSVTYSHTGGGRYPGSPIARNQPAVQWIDTSSNVTTNNIAAITG